MFSRGTRLLLDKNDLASFVPRASQVVQPFRQPIQQEYSDAVNDFWYHVLWTRKKIGRGELWAAKMCLDCYSKRLLLKMLEWHERAVRGPEYDTWFSGRFMDRWIDPAIGSDLPVIFARYDRDDIIRALDAMATLFRRVALETGGRWGLIYPAKSDEHVCGLVWGRTAVPAP